MSDTFKTPAGTELPILNLRGKDYLEVKYRIVWFREEHPDWTIETVFLESTKEQAFVKAAILTATGQLMATAHKFEDKQGFADHREKAETGAIGRALALIGYGTQFTGDDLYEGDRIIDSPAVPVGRAQALKSTPVGLRDGFEVPKAHSFHYGTHAKRGYHEIGAQGVREWCDNAEMRAANAPAKAPHWLHEEIVRAREWLALQ